MAIITLGGNLGAGKTTLAGHLKEALDGDYEELFIGGLMRDMAAEQNMTIEAFYARLKNNPELEKSVDERQVKLMREKTNLIVQGRVAWFFAKQSPHPSFNIFLAVAPEVGAQRVRQRPESRPGGGTNRTLEQVLADNTLRAKLELDRYKMLYGIENFLDPSHYDFMLDTTNLTEAEVLGKVIERIKGL